MDDPTITSRTLELRNEDDAPTIPHVALLLLRRGSFAAAGWLVVLGPAGFLLAFGATMLLGAVALAASKIATPVTMTIAAVFFALASLPHATHLAWLHATILSAYCAARTRRVEWSDAIFTGGLLATPGVGLALLVSAASFGLVVGGASAVISGIASADPLLVVVGLVATPGGLVLHARTLLAPAFVVLEGIGPISALRRSWRLARGNVLVLLAVAGTPLLFSAAFMGNAYNPFDVPPTVRFGAKVLACIAPFAAWLLHGALVVAAWDVLSRENRA